MTEDFLNRPNEDGEPQDLDLTPMIAIFSMLVLFLIGSTVITEQNISVPTHLNLPSGTQKEEISLAPQVIILDGEVKINAIRKNLSLSFFTPKFRGHRHRVKIRHLINNLQSQSEKGTTPFQILADRSLPYGQLYNLINELRHDGVKSFLFINEVKY